MFENDPLHGLVAHSASQTTVPNIKLTPVSLLSCLFRPLKHLQAQDVELEDIGISPFKNIGNFSEILDELGGVEGILRAGNNTSNHSNPVHGNSNHNNNGNHDNKENVSINMSRWVKFVVQVFSLQLESSEIYDKMKSI